MTRRGLTLIEVLAATFILAMIAATCVPTLRAALTAMDEQPAPFGLHELSILADQIVAAPAEFGFDSIEQVERLEIAWPEYPERASMDMIALWAPATDDETPPDHRWIAFTCGGWTTARWIKVEPEPKEPQP